MHLFYTPDINGNSYQLNEEESKHCIRVLRLAVGDEVHLTDGRGMLYTTRITNAQPKACIVEVVHQEKDFGRHQYFLHLAVAPTKNMERYEWVLEKITEIGIDVITPILCKHSERKVFKHERAKKIVIAAMKQSLKTKLPELHDLTEVKQLITQAFDGEKFICHCGEGERLLLPQALRPCSKALILIGPEGDFSPEEIALALKHGFKPVSLGDTRLRVETAALVACTYMQAVQLLNN
ncbi:MAG: 16S rRNA (uracil(1498)-N(3))-methyltransferase [Bacteroidales bacterium]|nr:16S rRNA (uracil(1498)-N(3))-methyltransferase [Bacteroidales bacterium]MCL2133725.1 16S rRNA (uracil(1498)-N(3))-methyltransferase [Bacteroidales bacterium]